MSESRNFLAERWATDHGYELVRCEYRMQSQGPFGGAGASESRPVYFVQVRDQQGTVRSGYIRFGRRFLGLLPDKPQVRWEG